MHFNTDNFLTEEPNPLHEWRHVNTSIGIISLASQGSRKNAKESLQNTGFIWFSLDGDSVRAVCPSGSRDKEYVVMVDFEDGEMLCECEGFTYNDGACKHIVSVLAKAIYEFEGPPSQDGGRTNSWNWIDYAIEESRNATSSRQAWEKEPSFKQEIARAYDAEVTTVDKGRREVTCYELDDGSYWTGPLPVPETDDMIMVYLPNGQKLPARVKSRELTDNNYCALQVKLGETPEHFSNNEIRVYGREVFRNDSQIQRQKHGSDEEGTDRQSSEETSRRRRRGRKKRKRSKDDGDRRRRR